MGFNLNQFLGKADDLTNHDFREDVSEEEWSDRQVEFVHQLEGSLKDLGESLGGHISISAHGQVNPTPSPGDTVVININAVPDPSAPTPPPVTEPGAVPVEGGSTSPATLPPNENATPEGNPAPASTGDPTQDPGVTNPMTSPTPGLEGQTPAVTSEGPDLGPSATEVPTESGEPAPVAPPADVAPQEPAADPAGQGPPVADPNAVQGVPASDVPADSAAPTAAPAGTIADPATSDPGVPPQATVDPVFDPTPAQQPGQDDGDADDNPLPPAP